MAAQIGSLYASLEAEFGRFNAGMGSAGDAAERAGSRIRKSMGGAADAVTALERHFNRPISTGALLAAGRAFDNVNDRASILRGTLLATTAVFGGLTAVLTTNVITRYADSWTGLKNQIGTVTQGTAQMRAELGAVGDVANRSFSSLSATATLFTRIQRAAPQEKPAEVLKYVETIQKGLLLGGATGEEARSAAIQFSQAIASNRLGGDEMRAVLETPLGGYLAKGLGVGVGDLRTMGSQGLITTQQMLKALATIAPQVDAEFSKFALSLDKAFTVFDNKATQAIGKFDETYGVTRQLSGGIVALAGNLQTLIPILASVGLGLAAIFTGRIAGGAVSRVTSSFGEFTKARQTALADARGEYEKIASQAERAKKALYESQSAMRTAGATGDFSKFADPSAAKAVAQAEAEIVKNQKERLNLSSKIQKEEEKLAAVQVATPARAAALAKANTAAEQKLIDLQNTKLARAQEFEAASKRLADTINAEPIQGDRKQLMGLYRASFDRASADEALTLAKGNRDRLASQLAAVNNRMSVDSEAWRSAKSLTEQLAAAEQDIASKSVTLHQADQALAQQTAAVEEKVSKERIAAIKAVADAKEVAGRRLAQAEDAVARTQQSVANRQTQIAAIQAAAVKKAEDERAAIVARQAKIQSELGRADQTGYYELRGNLAQAQGAAQASGRANIASQVTAQSEAYRQLAGQVMVAQSALDVAEGRASRAGMALGLLKSAGSSLVAFLGGPWGVAFTLATGALAYFGAKSAEAAQQHQEAVRIIMEENRKLADSSNGSGAAKATSNLIGREIDQNKERLQSVRNEMQRVQAEVSGAMFSAIAPLRSRDSLGAINVQNMRMYQQIADLIQKFKEGAISADEFSAKLSTIGAPSAIVAALNGEIGKIRPKADEASAAIDNINRKIGELDGKKAVVDIIINQRMAGALEAAVSQEIDYANSQKFDLNELNAKRHAFIYGQQQDNADRMAAANGDKTRMYLRELQKQAEQDNLGMTEDQLLPLAKARVHVDEVAEAHRKAESAARSQEKAEEALAKKIAEMKEVAYGAFLGEFDRKVLEEAKGMKFDPKQMAAYRQAAESGNFANAPSQLMDLRKAAIDVQAGQDYRSIIQEYGNAAQAAQMWGDKQAVLNRLVEEGKITSEQAAVSMGQFVASFGNYSWINDFSSAIGDFATSALTNFNNIGSAAKTLLDQIKAMIIKAAFVKPLENLITSGFGSLVGSTATGSGGSSSIFAGLFHSGGVVGGGGSGITVPAAAFTGAPRYHSGLLPNEMAAVLMKGETVLNAGMTKNMTSMVGNLAGMAAGAGRSTTEVNVHNYAGGDTPKVNRRRVGDREILDVVIGAVKQDMAGGGFNQVARGTFGLRPATRT